MNGSLKASILPLAHPCLMLTVKLALEHGHCCCEPPLKALSSLVWWFYSVHPKWKVLRARRGQRAEVACCSHTLFMLCRAPHWLELGLLLGGRRFYHLTNSEQR